MCKRVHTVFFENEHLLSAYMRAYVHVRVSLYVCVSDISGLRVQRVKQSACRAQEFRGPECVPLEPKANFEGFLACMAQTDKSPRGSSQTLSSPAHCARKRLFKHT